MRRALGLFLLIAVLVAVGVWFAGHPGQVSVEIDLDFGSWIGLGETLDFGTWRVDTSVGVLVVLAALLVFAMALLFRLWRAVVGAPASWRAHRRQRRREKGYKALTQGFVAVAAGHSGEAAKHARRADAFLDEPALTRLLAAQAAQLGGDDAAAQAYFRAIAEDPDAAFLGIRGLLMQAIRRGDREEARRLIAQALEKRPDTEWALVQLFDLQVADGDWDEAYRTNARALHHKAIDKPLATHRKAALALERARARAAADRSDEAERLAREAHEANRTLAPASVVYAELLAARGKRRRANRVLEEGWRDAPHPDLARAYARLDGDEDPLRRLKRVQKLTAGRPDHEESRAALAEAALEARLWGEARGQLERMVEAAPTRRAFRMMAQLEEAERNDAESARRWLERAADAPADKSWHCGNCGAATDSWHARCGHCGAFDRIGWQTPPRDESDGAGPATNPGTGRALVPVGEPAAAASLPPAAPPAPPSPVRAAG